MGEGGAVTCQDAGTAQELRRLRWCGISRSTKERLTGGRYAWDYSVTELGWKATLGDMAAALGREQLRRVEDARQWRLHWSGMYWQHLDGLGVNWIEEGIVQDGRLRMVPTDGYALQYKSHTHAHHLAQLRAPCRDELMAHLLAAGIQTGVHYRPLYKHPLFAGCRGECPVTERVWQELVSLPLHLALTAADVERVCAEVLRFYRK